MSKHPNDEVIRAWLDGEVIQCNKGDGWEDWGKDFSYTPLFGCTYTKWRIKPVVHAFAVGDLLVVTTNVNTEDTSWCAFAVNSVVKVSALTTRGNTGREPSYEVAGISPEGAPIRQWLTEKQVKAAGF